MGKGKMKDIKNQQDVPLWPEEQANAPSHDRMVHAHDHVACGNFPKPGWDEAARYKRRVSALMSHTSVMRIRRFLYL
jgi:hypothetical protein